MWITDNETYNLSIFIDFITASSTVSSYTLRH
jgi:hypothetical protein